MKKFLLVLGGAAFFGLNACTQDPARHDVNVNTKDEESQTIMDADNTSTTGQDTSTADMAEHTRFNKAQEADTGR